jgi:hypothetical protein
VLRVLRNPRYAGALTYGRRRDRKLPGGKTITAMLPREEWIAFIPGAHPGYVAAPILHGSPQPPSVAHVTRTQRTRPRRRRRR